MDRFSNHNGSRDDADDDDDGDDNDTDDDYNGGDGPDDDDSISAVFANNNTNSTDGVTAVTLSLLVWIRLVLFPLFYRCGRLQWALEEAWCNKRGLVTIFGGNVDFSTQ